MRGVMRHAEGTVPVEAKVTTRLALPFLALVALTLGILAFKAEAQDQRAGEAEFVAMRTARDAKLDDPTLTSRYYLKDLTDPPSYREDLRKAVKRKPDEFRMEEYWKIPKTHNGKYVWTDDYYNLLTILRVFARDD